MNDKWMKRGKLKVHEEQGYKGNDIRLK